MTISLRLSDEDTMLIKKYAAMNNISVSELIRKSVIERIEDEIDLDSYNKAMEDYKKDPVTYSHNEVKEMLGID
ncbi:MAG: type II toxin-antitoxin system RelB family antitoxin [Ruminococcus sp.]